MGVVLDTTTFDLAFKRLYKDGFEVVWYPRNPTLALIGRDNDWQGGQRTFNPLYEGAQGGATVSDAIDAMTTPSQAQFQCSRKKEFVFANIDNEALAASESTKGAIAKAFKTAMDSASYAMGEQLAHLFWSDGSGTRGTVATAGYSAGVVTLSDKRDIQRFAVNMKIVTKTSGTLNPGYAQITNRDPSNGKFTIVKYGGLPDPAAADTIARKGDYTASGGNVMDGYFSWIPQSTPSATLFNNVDRTLDITRLAGSRIVVTGLPIEEAAIESAAELKFQGGSADLLVLNTKRHADILKSAHSKMWVDSKIAGEKGGYKFSFKTVSFMGPDGPIDVVGDPKCPYRYGALMKRDSWELASLKDLPHWSNEDGLNSRVVPTADAVQVRLKGYGNYICYRPVDNAVLDFGA